MKSIPLMALALTLGACAGGGIGAVTGTVEGSKNLRTPEYAVKGATPYDQVWINTTTEALVDGFGQPRPKARPPEFDAPKQKAKPKVAAKAKPKAKPAPKRWLPWPKPKPKSPDLAEPVS